MNSILLYKQSCNVTTTILSEKNLELACSRKFEHDICYTCSFRGVEYVAVEKPAGAYTNILFSSGTTGKSMKINCIMVCR